MRSANARRAVFFLAVALLFAFGLSERVAGDYGDSCNFDIQCGAGWKCCDNLCYEGDCCLDSDCNSPLDPLCDVCDRDNTAYTASCAQLDCTHGDDGVGCGDPSDPGSNYCYGGVCRNPDSHVMTCNVCVNDAQPEDACFKANSGVDYSSTGMCLGDDINGDSDVFDNSLCWSTGVAGYCNPGGNVAVGGNSDDGIDDLFCMMDPGAGDHFWCEDDVAMEDCDSQTDCTNVPAGSWARNTLSDQDNCGCDNAYGGACIVAGTSTTVDCNGICALNSSSGTVDCMTEDIWETDQGAQVYCGDATCPDPSTISLPCDDVNIMTCLNSENRRIQRCNYHQAGLVCVYDGWSCEDVLPCIGGQDCVAGTCGSGYQAGNCNPGDPCAGSITGSGYGCEYVENGECNANGQCCEWGDEIAIPLYNTTLADACIPDDCDIDCASPLRADGHMCTIADNKPGWGSDGICIDDSCCLENSDVVIDCDGVLGPQFGSTVRNECDDPGPTLFDDSSWCVDPPTTVPDMYGYACEAAIDNDPSCAGDSGFKQDGLWIYNKCEVEDVVWNHSTPYADWFPDYADGWIINCSIDVSGYMCQKAFWRKSGVFDRAPGNFFFEGYCARNGSPSMGVYQCHYKPTAEGYGLVAMDCNGEFDELPFYGDAQLTDGGTCEVGVDQVYSTVSFNAGDACDRNNSGIRKDWNESWGYFTQTGTSVYSLNNSASRCAFNGSVAYNHSRFMGTRGTGFFWGCDNVYMGSMCDLDATTGGDFDHDGFCAVQYRPLVPVYELPSGGPGVNPDHDGLLRMYGAVCDSNNTAMDCDYDDDIHNNTHNPSDLQEGGTCVVGIDTVFISCSGHEGDACNTIDDAGTVWFQTGTCTNETPVGVCDTFGEVAYDLDTGSYMTNCNNASWGSPCDSDATSGGDFEQDGVCVINETSGNMYCDNETKFVVIDSDTHIYYGYGPMDDINDWLNVYSNFTDVNFCGQGDQVYRTCELGSHYQNGGERIGGDGDACSALMTSGEYPKQTGTCAYNISSGSSICWGGDNIAYFNNIAGPSFFVPGCDDANPTGGDQCENGTRIEGDFDHEGYCIAGSSECYRGTVSMDCDGGTQADYFDVNECEPGMDIVRAGCTLWDSVDYTYEDGNHFRQDGLCLWAFPAYDSVAETARDNYDELVLHSFQPYESCENHPGDGCDFQANFAGDYVESGACVDDNNPRDYFYDNFNNGLDDWLATGYSRIAEPHGVGHGVLYMNGTSTASRNGSSNFILDFKVELKSGVIPSSNPGFLFRLRKDTNTFYKLSLTVGNNIGLSKAFVPGSLVMVPSPVPFTDTDEFVQVRLIVTDLIDHTGTTTGTTFSVYVNEQDAIQYTDFNPYLDGNLTLFQTFDNYMLIDDYFFQNITLDATEKDEGELCCFAEYVAGDRGLRWSNLGFPYNTADETMTLTDGDEDCGCTKPGEGDFCIADPMNGGSGLQALYSPAGNLWPGRCAYNGIYWNCDERIKDCFIDTDIINNTDCDNSTIIGCTIQNCDIQDSFLMSDPAYVHDCVCINSTIYNSTLIGVQVYNSEIRNSSGEDSYIDNSDMNDSHVRFSTIIDTNFCGGFDVYGALVYDYALLNGRIIYGGEIYTGPYDVGDICSYSAPSPVGSLVFRPDIANRWTNVSMIYFAPEYGVGYEVRIPAAEATQAFQNIDYDLVDDGILPDEVAYDAIYTNRDVITEAGNAELSIRANVVDPIGNTFTVSGDLIVDNTDPNASIVINGDDPLTKQTLVMLNLTYEDDYGVSHCRYANTRAGLAAAFDEPCSSYREWYLEPGLGMKQVWYYVEDVAGNWRNVSDTINLTETLENIIITAPPPDTVVGGVITLNFVTDDEFEDIHLSIDGGDYFDSGIISWSTWQASYQLDTTTLTDGSHYFQIRDIDSDGSYVYSPKLVLLVDNSPEAVTIIIPRDGDVITGLQEVVVDSADNTYFVEFNIDGGPLEYTDYDGTDTWNWTWNSTQWDDGVHEIKVEAYDERGWLGIFNRRIGEDSIDVVVDNLGNVTFSLPAWVNNLVLLTVTDTTLDSVMFEISSDGVNFVPIGSDDESPFIVPWDTRDYPDGQYFIRAVGTDFSGQLDNTIETTRVDNTGPQVLIIMPTAGETVSGMMNIWAEPNDGIGRGHDDTTSLFYLDGEGPMPADYFDNGAFVGVLSIDTTTMRDGNHFVKATFEDLLGNLGESENIPFIVDNTPESIDIFQPLSYELVSDVMDIIVFGPDDTQYIDVNVTDSSGCDLDYRDSSAPFEVFWDVALCGEGLFNITASGYNDFGAHIGDDMVYEVRVDLEPEFDLEPIPLWVNGVTNVTAIGVEDTVESILIEYTADMIDFYTIGSMTKEDVSWVMNFDTTQIIDGPYWLKATSTNRVGATNITYSNQFNIDNTAPDLIIDTYYALDFSSGTGYNVRDLVYVIENSTDGIGVGVDLGGSVSPFEISFDGGPFVSVDNFADIGGAHYYYPWNTNLTSDDEHMLQMRVVDILGNMAYSNIITRKVSNDQPFGELIIEPFYVSNGMVVDLTYHGTPLDYNVSADMSTLDDTGGVIYLLDTDNDTVFTTNYLISILNTLDDGYKTVYGIAVRLINGSIISKQISGVAFLDNTPPNGSMEIWPLGETGVPITGECTSKKTVVLELDSSDVENNGMSGVKDCRFGNSLLSMDSWEPCVDTRAWQLSSGVGLKTVFYEVRDESGNVFQLNDTIYYDYTGACLDTTPPSAPDVVDDGDYTDDNTSLHVYWVNSTDREQEILQFPLSYRFRLIDSTENLLLNPSFETGDSDGDGVMDRWYPDSSPNATHSTNSVDGLYSQTFAQGNIYQDVAVDPDTNYTLTTYMRIQGAPANSLHIIICDLSIGCLAPLHDFDFGSPMLWTENSFTFNSRNAENIRVMIVNNNPQIGYVDDVSLTRVTGLPHTLIDWIDTYDNEVNVENLELVNGREYTFEVRAVNVGGFESQSSYSDGIVVDVGLPGLTLWSDTHPDEDQWFGETVATMSWTGNDVESGIYGYSYVFDTSNDTEPDEVPEGEIGHFDENINASYNVANGIYYFHIRSRDNAGWWGDTYHYRVMVDEYAGPPEIIRIRPQGVSATGELTLYIETNEPAVCEYNRTLPASGDNYTVFDYTGYTDHSSQLSLADGDYQYWFNCTDFAGNFNDWNFTNFTVIEGVIPDNLSITDWDPPYFVLQDMDLDVLITFDTVYGPIGLSNLEDDIVVRVDAEAVPSVSTYLGGGHYKVRFIAPEYRGTYDLEISARGVSDSRNDFDVDDYSLSIRYIRGAGESLTMESGDQYVAGQEEYFKIGIASDYPSPFINVGAFGMRTNALSRNYIFATAPKANVEKRVRYIYEGLFEDLIFPSFGLPLKQDACMIATTLTYPGVEITNEDDVDEGLYSVVIKNEGLTENGSVNISINII